ncbi:MAG: tetratricopeptide repeat protein [Bryobacteraceae bacterium]
MSIRSRFSGAALLMAFSMTAAWAQHSAPSPSNPGGASPGNPIGSASGTTSLPNATRNSPTTGIQAQTIFLFGQVIFDDGAKPTNEIVMELVCNGNPRPQGHTDAKGHFSFQVGQNPEAIDTQDASVGTYGGGLGSNGMPNSSLQSIMKNGNCDLRARYPGYRSDTVELGMYRMLDSPNVGTIVLHRLTNVAGTTISATSGEAPKAALKDYDKGRKDVQNGKLDEAAKRFQEAVSIYPNYAVAWFALGDIQRVQGHPDAAAASFKSAIAADAKYVSPYDRLALLALQSGNWKDAESYSKQSIALNPVEVPTSYLYNAAAALHLNQGAEAEQSSLALMKIDTTHQFPDAEALLSHALLIEGKYPEAATHIRAYLLRYPNTKEAPVLKQALAKIDPASAVAKN